MRLTNSVTIARPAPDVFAYLAQFENVPRWNYAISRTWKLTDGPVGVGSRYRQERTVPKPGREDFEIVEYEPNVALAIQGRLGPFAARLSYRLDPIADTTTLVTNDVELEVGGLLRLAAPLATGQIKKSVAANLDVLKQLLESRVGP